MKPDLNLLPVIAAVVICSVMNAVASDSSDPDLWQNRAVPAFMTVAGLSIAGLWTADLISGQKVDASQGVFRIKDRESGQNLLPHLIAEYATAGCLIAGAVGLYRGDTWGRDVAMVGLGALSYTSVNSLGWVVSKRERFAYGIPMVITLVGSGISFAVLF